MLMRFHYRNSYIVAQLQQDGWQLVGPVSGSTACGEQGLGRMAEPAEILQAVQALG